MANYQKIVERHPEFKDFLGGRVLRYRGEVMSYAPNLRRDSLTTDARGFRHSTLDGKSYSARDCVRSERYGVVLGPSSTFGFGIAGNDKTMASLLAERFGFPFANCSMPGGSSRNLHAVLLGIMTRSPKPPEVVVFSNGGDLATFCAASVADSVFGSPNHGQLSSVKKRSGFGQNPSGNLPRLFAFTSMWTTAIATLCRAHRTRLVMLHQSTFFDKTRASAAEAEMELGTARRETQQRHFENHRSFNAPFYERRRAIAQRLRVPLAGWGLTDQLSFLDEFHCDAKGVALLSDAVAAAIEPLLGAAQVKGDVGALTGA